MFSWLYAVWALLPLTFLLLTIWGASKKVFKVHGREYTGSYLNQFVYTSFALAISIYLDQTVLESLFDAIAIDLIDISIARWLLYPAVLVAGAYAQGFFSKAETDMRHGRTKAYQR